jgi:NADH-quinone oxidoreductase subunit N
MNTFSSLTPLLIIVAGALLVLILEVFLKKEKKDYLAYISIVFLLGSVYAGLRFWNQNPSYFNGKLLLDNFALFFIFILAIATILVTLSPVRNDDHGFLYGFFNHFSWA